MYNISSEAPLYEERTKPYEHQRVVLAATRDRTNFGVFWEQGTGKTKLAVDTAGWLFSTGKIDAVFVLAPTGIHENWDVPGEGVQRHLPEALLKASCRVTWRSAKAGQVAAKQRWNKLLAHKGGMRWLFMGFDAFITKRGFDAAQQFMSTHRCLWVIDEAARIKNVKAQRTKYAMKLRHLAAYRRPMTGTPVAQKPFDVYALVKWMMPTYWLENGIGSFMMFRHTFGVWRQQRINGGRLIEVQSTDAHNRPIYKDLDRLAKMLKPISSRVLKVDVLDLPPKIYTTYYYDLTSEQRRHYDRLEKEYYTWQEENTVPDPDNPGRLLLTSAELALVRQLRMQQICMGYLVDDEKNMHIIPGGNPALSLLEELTEDMGHQGIIWGRFRMDIELILERLGREKAFRYDGTVGPEDRVKAIAGFQAGDRQWFVATPATAGEGVTLTAARTVIYYSNSRRLTERLQSEDRAHRIGQLYSVDYIDLVARDTITGDILDTLRHNEDVAASAIGDRIRARILGAPVELAGYATPVAELKQWETGGDFADNY